MSIDYTFEHTKKRDFIPFMNERDIMGNLVTSSKA